MIRRILLAVDDSPDALAAARLAVEVAAGLGAALRAGHVVADHEMDALLQTGTSQPGLPARRTSAGAAVLTRISGLAAAQGVSATTSLLQGDVADAVLAEARAWQADLVIVGRSFRSASGRPYVGGTARHVLEFATQPVLVVPPPP